MAIYAIQGSQIPPVSCGAVSAVISDLLDCCAEVISTRFNPKRWDARQLTVETKPVCRIKSKSE